MRIAAGRWNDRGSIGTKTEMRLCQKSDFGPAYHKLGSYQVSI